MDPLRIHAYKIQAMKKHKSQQFLGNVLLYSLTTLTCTLFCSSPLWYPPFCATFNVLFFFSLPRIYSLFFTSKVLFIVGNLIVIFLVGESKFFASKTKASPPGYNHVCYKKHERKGPELQTNSSPRKQKKGSRIAGSSLKQDIKVNSKSCESYGEEKIFESHNRGEKEVESHGVEEKYKSYAMQETLKSRGEEKVSCRRGKVRVVEEEKEVDGEVDEDLSLPAEELNKLADDFIARINRQRRLEAEFCRG